jgi:hypothetical protein
MAQRTASDTDLRIRFYYIYDLVEFSGKLFKPQECRPTSAKREGLWKDRWVGTQHSLAIYDLMINTSGHERLHSANIDELSFRDWFVFILTCTIVADWIE